MTKINLELQTIVWMNSKCWFTDVSKANLYYFGSWQSLFYAWGGWEHGRWIWDLPPPDYGIFVNSIAIRGDSLCPPHYYQPPRISRPSYGPGDDHVQPLIGDGSEREQRVVRKFEFMNIEYINVECTATLCNLRK